MGRGHLARPAGTRPGAGTRPRTAPGPRTSPSRWRTGPPRTTPRTDLALPAHDTARENNLNINNGQREKIVFMRLFLMIAQKIYVNITITYITNLFIMHHGLSNQLGRVLFIFHN